MSVCKTVFLRFDDINGYTFHRLYSSVSEGHICYVAELWPPLHTFRQTAVTRAVGLPLLSVKTSDALFVHKFPWSEWIGGNKGSLAHPTRMPQAARRDRYGMG